MKTTAVTWKSLEKMQAHERVLLIDLRDDLAFRCGHLTNAIQLHPRRLSLLIKNINPEIKIVFYCDDGLVSEECCTLFSEMNLRICYYLQGGYQAWIEEKMKTSPSDALCQWLSDQGYDCSDLERRSYNGETALMFAARQGKTEFVVDLIDRGAQLDARNNDGNSALWLACYANNKHSLAELIRAGAQLNIQNDNGATALIYAASAGRYDMVDMLLAAGANTALTTLDDFSALDVASTSAILKLLKSHHRQQKLAS
ncbi:MAG: ankyrin repeat domain-containing protein [Pseudomonadales bacterium]|nr:ankyrin repeat domain-containing protein [Pseudomonadales bacterium]